MEQNGQQNHQLHSRVARTLERAEHAGVITAIRNGLVMSIPILLIGAFALILQNLPVDAYQRFLSAFLSGTLSTAFAFVNSATFGLLSVYMTIFISTCYVRQKPTDSLFPYGASATAMICFAILAGMGSNSFSVDYLGVKGMFTAIVCATAVPVLYMRLSRWFVSHRRQLRADGADAEFNNAVSVILPALMIILLFSAVRLVITQLFGVSGLHELFILVATKLFLDIRSRFLSGLLFVLLSSLMWFFGVHGSNVLEGVSETLLVPAAPEIATGLVADTQIVTKAFIDTFVLMGGCGTAISLLIAILLFSKRRANRSLGRMAAVPMLFNINEIMIFGLPVVFNPCFLAPFICAPLAAYLISFTAMHLGLVPIVSTQVHWTAPILLGGYRAVGSVSGAVLQLVCAGIGVLIYKPFVRIYDKVLFARNVRCIAELTKMLKESEENNIPVMLTALRDEHGGAAKVLAADLRDAIETDAFSVYYQPQYHHDGSCVGAEALLRYKHYQVGMVYPPLVIKLVDELGLLEALEIKVLRRVVDDLPLLRAALGKEAKISVNVSGKTVQSETYIAFLQSLMDGGQLAPRDIWLEITEQMAFLSPRSDEAFSRIRQMGYPMIIDDFSMGHTSLKYLQMNPFDLVKLDGSLVHEVVDNPRVREIISSIVFLSQTLQFDVLAEFVETREQAEALAAIGCMLYQGYLFSAAVPIETLPCGQAAGK